MPKDISNLLPGSVNLEKSAMDKFGAAVDTQSGRMPAPRSAPSQEATTSVGEEGVWSPTHYASALVKHDTVDFNPKLKFMFKVSFKFAPLIADMAQELGYDLNKLQNNLSFIVRHVDRPKFDFDYEEVNMYNFRTKVLKSIKHREVSLTVYDDIGNNALSFVNVYRKLLQPIARAKQDPLFKHEDYGFSDNPDSTSMRSLLIGGRKNVLSEMTIHQIFVERGSDVQDAKSWVKVVNFVFMNPRFSNIDIDDLDHENGGNFNIVTFSVDFDTVFMDEPQLLSGDTDGPSFALGDITTGGTSTSTKGGGGQMNFNQGYRDYASPPYTGLSDGGATDIDDTQNVGGILDEAGSKSIRGMMNSQTPQFARVTPPPVIDNTTPPSLAQLLTRQTSSSDDGEFA